MYIFLALLVVSVITAASAAETKNAVAEDKPSEAPSATAVLVKNGKLGKALSCDGLRGCIEVPHDSSLEPEQLTIEAWIRMSRYPSGVEGRRWIVGKNENEWALGHYGLIVRDKKVGAYINTAGGRQHCWDVLSEKDLLKLDTWHHLAATYDGKILRAYADGKSVGSEEVNEKRVSGKGVFAIGKRPDDYIFFEGLIDEVRVYKSALSAKKIKKRFENPEGSAEDKNLVRVWHFEKEEKAVGASSDVKPAGKAEPAP